MYAPRGYMPRLSAAGLAILICTINSSADPIGFVQTNLTSSVPGVASNFDPNLKNPWGMSFGLNTPFWVSDQVTGVSTLYNALGVPQALIVTIPPHPGAGPTGQVFAGGQGFTMNTGGQASFVFATLDGTIDAWNGGTTAVVQQTTPGASYTGLAIAGNLLYAADTAGGKIDVFNNAFQPTTVSGSFVDPNVPAGFTPYNIQTIGDRLYVEYALEDQPGGYIGVFDLQGHLLMHISDMHLDSPWGITLAPLTFPGFGGALLVGNEGNGMINAFNATTGAFLGTLLGVNGQPIVNEGLWALAFRSPSSSFDPNTLFFVAGINDETEGLFGEIRVVPEPSTITLLGLGFSTLAVAWRSRRARHVIS
jgi:uncharacterized protein (TIGR03118 family)